MPLSDTIGDDTASKQGPEMIWRKKTNLWRTITRPDFAPVLNKGGHQTITRSLPPTAGLPDEGLNGQSHDKLCARICLDGISQITDDLLADPLQKPFWAQPTESGLRR
jgi:hypothetical protein